MGKKRAPGAAGLVIIALVLVSMMLAGVVARHSGEAPPGYDLLAGFTEPDRGANPADNAWPLYQKALFELVAAPSPKCYHVWPGELGWDQTQEWLDENRALLPVLTEAAGREHYGRPDDPVRVAESWVEFHRREQNSTELAAAVQRFQEESEKTHGI
ncbi:MAG: hypothetical protein V2A76_00215 [Planctomycetota bacterium]